jgi:hypothetical protein
MQNAVFHHERAREKEFVMSEVSACRLVASLPFVCLFPLGLAGNPGPEDLLNSHPPNILNVHTSNACYGRFWYPSQISSSLGFPSRFFDIEAHVSVCVSSRLFHCQCSTRPVSAVRTVVFSSSAHFDITVCLAHAIHKIAIAARPLAVAVFVHNLALHLTLSRKATVALLLFNPNPNPKVQSLFHLLDNLVEIHRTFAIILVDGLLGSAIGCRFRGMHRRNVRGTHVVLEAIGRRVAGVGHNVNSVGT